ncbi:MAG: hypothetical protein IJH83_01960, partial [Coriobacteriales bacterium]|nr:hypothetical protein [Coriobacteriales bacterium]
VEFSAKIEGDTTGLSYSYAWSWEGQWGDNWSSTKLENDGQMTTETSGAFLAKKEGTDSVWIDVDDGKGNTAPAERVAVTVTKVPPAWTITGIEVQDSAYVGDDVPFSAIIEGDATGLKYSYAWSWEGQWGDNWSSTKLRNNGEMTTETSDTFKAAKEGTYSVWIEVDDGKGTTATAERVAVTVTKVPPEWTLKGIEVTDSAYIGDEVEFSAKIEGDTTGLSYSYAWSWEGQ